MKLRNKKTGEIVDSILEAVNRLNNGKNTFTLAEINEEWEDYQEPKEEWYINCTGEVLENNKAYCNTVTPEKLQSIGNYFGTKEEAERAVEKLKAWKRVKEKGFRFRKWDWSPDQNVICGDIMFYIKDYSVDTDDLDLLFGGEE